MIAGLRERKREQSRASTVRAAWRLFIEHGYDNVTVADICTAADIAPRTFHRYFPSKEDVVAEPMRRMATIVSDHIATAPPTASDVAVLHGAMTALGRFAVDNRDLLIALRLVAEHSHHIRGAYLGRPEHEREIVGHLTARHPDADPDAWPRRLLVACTVATYRLWLEDYFRVRFADPLERLHAILGPVFTAAQPWDDERSRVSRD